MQNPWNAVIKTTATILVNTKLLDILERMMKGKAKAWEIGYMADLGLGSATKADLKILDDIMRNYKNMVKVLVQKKVYMLQSITNLSFLIQICGKI